MIQTNLCTSFLTVLTALWLLVYFEGKNVLWMLSNFLSTPYSSRRKQNCSLPACPLPVCPSPCSTSGSTARDESVAAGTWPLGLKALGRLHIGKQIPISRAKLLQTGDTSGVVWNWLKWLRTRRREERLEGKWKKCLLHISLSFPSACVLLLWAIKQLQCSLPEETAIQWRWRMIPTT